MALTTAQRTDMQGDLGISADETVFTNAELDRLYARVGDDYNLAVFFGYRQLLAQANKFHDYTEGMTQVKRSQMRASVKDSMKLWRGEGRQQVRMIGLAGVPPPEKDTPSA